MMLRKKNTFYCFSPEIMIATMLIEAILAIYLFLMRKKDNVVWIGAVILSFLAIFQFAEFQICAGSYSEIWAIVGFVVITFLPVLSLDLVSRLTYHTPLVQIGYDVALIISIIILFFLQSFGGTFCGGNYVIFHASSLFFQSYAIYYFGFLFAAIYLALNGIEHEKLSKSHKRALEWLIFGYLSFILPMGFILFYYQTGWLSVPSIMCGFAVIYAIVLALCVIPSFEEKD